MSQAGDRLFDLLPIVHRQRDEESGGPLKALLSVIAEQVDIVEQDIARLYENWFIETCDDWVVPYLGDLIGYRLAPEVRERAFVDYERQGTKGKVFVSRREVANTLRYRRRKGSLALLEFLANDVAGWPARAVEFYRLVAANQGLKHHGMPSNYLVDLRFGDDIDRVNTPFDEVPHTVDVRRLGSHRSQGLYNPTHVGLFVWRLKPYSVSSTQARGLDLDKDKKSGRQYTFDAFGHDVPLYTLPVEEPEPTHIADETNLPVPIRRRALSDQLVNYYGEGKSFCIWANEHDKADLKLIDSGNIVPADLSKWSCPTLDGDQVAVDSQLGRILFARPPRVVHVAYHYGFSADIGGGEYSRPIRQPSLASVSLFQESHIEESVLGALKQGQDAISCYVRTQLSKVTQELLQACDPAHSSEELLDLLVNDLNDLLRDEHLYDEGNLLLLDPEQLITILPSLAANSQSDRRLHANRLLNGLLQDEHLYDKERLRSVDPQQLIEALQILAGNLQGDRHLYANRLLLEAAYEDLVKGFRLYKVNRATSLESGIKAWEDDQPRYAVIEITESGRYGLAKGNHSFSLQRQQYLQVRAANAVRPVIHGTFNATANFGSRLLLDGLLIEGNLALNGVDETAQAEVSLRHCTVMSGEPVEPESAPSSQDVEGQRHHGKRQAGGSPSLELTAIGRKVVIESSIVGPVRVSQHEVRTEPVQISIVNSIIDAGSDEAPAVGAPNHDVAHAVLSIEHSTMLGQVRAHAIDLAKNAIFTGRVQVDRHQRGEMRFCYVPAGSHTPNLHQCQPELAAQDMERQLQEAIGRKPTSGEIETAKGALRSHIRPSFTSRQHGAAAYCQLALFCPQEIVRGADDEGEMGVFHDLHSPQRLANLEARLNEYVPAGMEAGVIVAS